MKRRSKLPVPAPPHASPPAFAAPARAALAWLDRRDRALVWALAVLMTAVYATVCAIKYRWYLYDDFDLAIFVQALDRALHGSMFVSIRGMNWLGDHSSLSLFLLLPFYALVRHPLALLVAQAAAVMLAAVAVRRLARHEGLPGAVAVACSVAYLLYPAAGYSVLYEFHPETLSTPALLFAFLFLRQGRTVPLAIAAFLAVLGKEDAALVVGAMGLYALTRREDARRLGHAALLGGLGIASLAVTFALLQPLNAGQAEYGRMYQEWGATTGEALRNMLAHPLQAAWRLVDSPGNPYDGAIKLEYWLHLLMPLGFLPLLSPLVMLVAFPVIAAHLLSSRVEQHTVLFQYTAFVTPFMASAAVLGLARAARWTRRPRSAAHSGAPPALALGLGAWMIVASLACQPLFGPLLGRGVLQAQKPRQVNLPTALDRALRPHRDSLLARVPAQGGVVAPFEFLARLAHRPDVHSIHHVLSGTYNFSTRPYPVPEGVSAMIVDHSMAGSWYAGPGSSGRLRELIGKNRLRPAASAGNFTLYVRDARDSVEVAGPAPGESSGHGAIGFDGVVEFLGGDSLPRGAGPGGRVRFRTLWRRTGETDRIYLTAISLLDSTGAPEKMPVRNLGGVCFPLHDWPRGIPVREPIDLVLPADLGPGRYRVALSVGWRIGIDRSGPAVPDDPRVQAGGGWVTIGSVDVAASRR